MRSKVTDPQSVLLARPQTTLRGKTGTSGKPQDAGLGCELFVGVKKPLNGGS